LVTARKGNGSGRQLQRLGGDGRQRYRPDSGSTHMFQVVFASAWVNKVLPSGGPLLTSGKKHQPRMLVGTGPRTGSTLFTKQRQILLGTYGCCPNQGVSLSAVPPKAFAMTTGPISFSSPLPSRDGKKLFVSASSPHSELCFMTGSLISSCPIFPVSQRANSKHLADGQWVAYVAYPEGTLWRQ